MTAGELVALYRSEMGGTGAEFILNTQMYRYLDEAYKLFVRLIGGIEDSFSAITALPVVATQPEIVLDKSILKILKANRLSDEGEVDIINYTDLSRSSSSDYGNVSSLSLTAEGQVNALLIGIKPGIVRCVNIPTANDTLQTMVERLPLVDIASDSHPLDEIDARYHTELLDYVHSRVYRRPGAPFFDLKTAEYYEGKFMAMCAGAKKEKSRLKSKVRVVQYKG